MIPQQINEIGQLFSDAGYEIRIIGGWVRDKLRGIAPKDLDLASPALPHEVITICEANGLKHTNVGANHGTIGLVLNHVMYEVTTLRIDRETDGRHAEVEFTADWQKDAERRDFTINAMSMALDGTLFDYFDGQRHIEDHRVVFVGNADNRLTEDYLRILRYFRFCDRIGDFTFEYGDSIKRHAHGLQQISGERIWMEMAKILTGDHVDNTLSAMSSARVLDQIGLSVVDPSRAAHVRSATRNPITILAALTPNAAIAAKWHMSRNEQTLFTWLQERRDRCPKLAELKEIATTGWYSPTGLTRAIEYAAMFGQSELLETIRAWNPPVRPIMGRDLLEIGYPSGSAISEMLKTLERRWKNSDYQLTKEQLIASLYVED